ncbi:hypothetical protein [Staphylococcus equorum]|uniref:hypothetical protein n=1 Tax=Staphylococcus equorum TaxID=246432 RepID=UPI001868DFA0|nr:hypothetical protein [Staphylococcus equorum]
MTVYNLFWNEDYGTSWAFLGTYDSKENAEKGITENFCYRGIEQDEIHEYEEEYFIEEVTMNQHVVKEYFN